MKLAALKRGLVYQTLRLLRQRQGSHRIALGFALGFLPCWFPTFGADVLLALALLRLCRGNMAAGMFAVLFGTLLWPILFYVNYAVGHAVRRGLRQPADPEVRDILADPAEELRYDDTVESLGELGGAGLDFLTGALLNSVLGALLLYLLFRLLWTRCRAPLLRRARAWRARSAGGKRISPSS